MTEVQILAALKKWVIDYCRNEFLINNPDYDADIEGSEEYIEELPGGVDLFLNQGVNFIKNQSGVSAESLGDHSITWTTDFPKSLLQLLYPYRLMFPKRKKLKEWKGL